MMDREERYREALEKTLFAIPAYVEDYIHLPALLYAIRDIAREALTEPPQFREVEVVRWTSQTPDGSWLDCEIYNTKEMAEATGHVAVPIYHTRKVPIRTVKRRELMGLASSILPEYLVSYNHVKPPSNAEVYCEYDEEVEP